MAAKAQTSSPWRRLSEGIHKLAVERGPSPFPAEQPIEIRAQLQSLKVLDRLSDRQQLAVAQFVWDVTQYIEHTPKREWLRAFQRSNQHLRKLNEKGDKLKKAFADLDDYWTRIGGNRPDFALGDDWEPRGNVLLVNDLDEEPGVTWILEQIGNAIHVLNRVPTRVDISQLKGSRTATIKTFVAVALNDLFLNQCGFSNNESEIRVAKIGNQFWHWGFGFREKSTGPELWRGSEAVRKILKRHARRQQGTHEKKTTTKK